MEKGIAWRRMIASLIRIVEGGRIPFTTGSSTPERIDAMMFGSITDPNREVMFIYDESEVGVVMSRFS